MMTKKRNSKNISYYNLLREATQYHVYCNNREIKILVQTLSEYQASLILKIRFFRRSEGSIELTKDKFQSNFEHF